MEKIKRLAPKAEVRSTSPTKELRAAEHAARVELAALRERAVQRERRRLAKWAVARWRATMKRSPRFFGPFELPRAAGEMGALVARLEQLSRSAEGAAVAFVLACLLRSFNRKLGTQAVAHTLHPDCLQPGEGATIRKHSLRLLQGLADDTAQSYAVGPGPKRNYAVDRDAVRVELDTARMRERAVVQATGARRCASAGPETAEVYVKSTGTLPTHPTSRPLTVRRHGKRWYVRSFDRFCAAVARGRVDWDDDAWATAEADADAAYDPFAARRSSVLRDPDAALGWSAPINFGALRRRLVRGETADAAHQRYEMAKDETAQLASKLSRKEMLERWAADPSTGRVVLRTAADGTLLPDVLGPDEVRAAVRRAEAELAGLRLQEREQEREQEQEQEQMAHRRVSRFQVATGQRS